MVPSDTIDSSIALWNKNMVTYTYLLSKVLLGTPTVSMICDLTLVTVLGCLLLGHLGQLQT